jgi:hypothetical protein
MRKIRYELNGNIYHSCNLFDPINDHNSDVSLEKDKDGQYYILPNKGGLSFIDELNSGVVWIEGLFRLGFKINEFRKILNMRHVSILPRERMELKKFEKKLSRIEMYLSDDIDYSSLRSDDPDDSMMKIISSALLQYSWKTTNKSDSIISYMYNMHIRTSNMSMKSIISYDNSLSRLVSAAMQDYISFNGINSEIYKIKYLLSNILQDFKTIEIHIDS